MDHVHFVQGALDKETRCRHYHQLNDRIAIKCFCCRKYFSCYRCHEELTGKPFQPWPASRREEKAVLCGNCSTELTINEYLHAKNHCPSCSTSFNPKCALHYDLYFEMEKGRSR